MGRCDAHIGCFDNTIYGHHVICFLSVQCQVLSVCFLLFLSGAPCFCVNALWQEPTKSSKRPIRARYLGHVTGYQPIRDQYFLVRSFPALWMLKSQRQQTGFGEERSMLLKYAENSVFVSQHMSAEQIT